MMKFKAVLSFVLCIALFAGMLVLPAGAAVSAVTITFDTAGGTPVATITQDEGTAVTPPADPVKLGYIFNGWWPAVPAIMPADDLTCEAQWDIRPDPSVCNTIHFDPGGGRWYPDPYGIDPIIVVDEGGIPYPPTLTREGYIFMGWVPAIPSYCPVEDITCVAQWVPDTRTIIFESDGGSLIEPITQDVGTEVIPPPDPTKEDYFFMGWSPPLPAIMPVDDIICFAQWEQLAGIPTSITFDSNGGTAVDPITQDEGTPVTAPADPVKAGFTFMGWEPPVPAIFPEYDMVCVAQWEENAGIGPSIIYFDSNGGTPVDPIVVDPDEIVICPPDPTREGYTFMGWLPPVPASYPVDDITHVAQWEPIIYTSTITFDSAGGSPVDPITQDEGTEVIPPADPTKTGCTFMGWIPDVPAIMPEDDITCVAQWTGNTYTVTFDSGAGTVFPIDKSVIYGSTYGDLPVPTGEVEGLVFAGWWTEVDTEVTDTSIVSITRNHTLYSRWDVACHTLTLKLNDGTDSDYFSDSLEYKVIVLYNYFYSSPAGGNPEIPDPNLYYITYDYEYYNAGEFPLSVSFGLAPPARSGYDFVGWSESPAGSSVSHSTTIENTDITMYAVWVSNHKSTITFDSNGGTAVTPIYQDEGTLVESPADPSKAGYIFVGWSPAVPAIMPEDDINCVAQWRLLGDLDNNGSITSIDALMVLQGCTGECVLSSVQRLAADANHDGRISPLDALMLLHAASGLIKL